MKVILLQDIPSLGRKSDVKDVSDGYARNFLLPRRMAAPATDAALGAISADKSRRERERAAEIAIYTSLVERLRGMTLILKTKVGEKGKAFGAITPTKIRDALKKEGIAVEKEWLVAGEPIKTTGEHAVAVRFPHDIAGKIKVMVQSE
jgi:large subunit ribosomal protein L9